MVGELLMGLVKMLGPQEIRFRFPKLLERERKHREALRREGQQIEVTARMLGVVVCMWCWQGEG